MSGETTEVVSQAEQSGESDESACCGSGPGIKEETLVADVQLLSALGNSTRYELVRHIGAADEEVCVCELESAVGVSQSAVSQALSRLYAAGLLTRRKEGSWRYYGLTDAARQLLDTLTTVRADDG
jgi:ArsR family transcriptional regulator